MLRLISLFLLLFTTISCSTTSDYRFDLKEDQRDQFYEPRPNR